jgi:protein TonB
MKMGFLILILLANINLRAQKDVPPPPKDSQNSKDTIGVFDKVDIEARFPGGDSAWRNYLENNFRVEPVSDAVWKELPAKTKRKSGSVNLTAIVQFIVCKDGSLCEIKTINKIPLALKAEAERLIAESKLWEPAMQNGRQVKAYRRQPITLVIPID